MSSLKVPIINNEGKQVGEQKLSTEVFGVAMKPTVLHEAVIAQQANARKPVAHTKTRGEVSGGGKKPWRQKGTGRARHGSSRSPIWVGGGITFGPRPDRNFSVKLNRKVKNLAIRMSVSDKVGDGKLVVLDILAPTEIKTKTMSKLLGVLPVKAKRTLVVLPSRDEKVTKSFRNIPGVKTANAASLSLVDIISAGVLVTTVSGIERIESVLSPKK